MTWPRVAIAGGSIGGLTTAVLLRDLGCQVDVYERSSSALQSRGAGIVVLPITERYVTERSHHHDERVSLELTWWTYVDASGATIARHADHYRFSGWNTVYRALLNAFDPDHYHLDREVVDVRPGVNPALILATGDAIEADLVVCADGLWSTARGRLLPGTEPRYAGYVAWRGTAPVRTLSARARRDVADQMLYQVLDHSHILVYAMPAYDGSLDPDDRVMNFVWYRNYPPPEAYRQVMTGRDGVLHPATVPPGHVAQRHLDDLHEEARRVLAPTLAEIVLASADTFVQAIFDLDSPAMAFGRACVLGDAAFAVRPHVAAGQAKACADAWALRDSLLEAGGNVDRALASWEPRQLELGRSVVARSAAMGHRSQVSGTMVAGDPSWKFGLFPPDR